MSTTKILTDLAVDDPLVQDANYRFNSTDRQYIDEQILGTQQHIVDNLINGKHASWYDLSATSSSVVAGDTVCLSSSIPGAVIKAVSSAPGLAGSILGVVVQAAAPGGKVLVAINGILSPTITGLGTGTTGLVKVNTTTSRLEYTSTPLSTDYLVGTVDSNGWLTLGRFGTTTLATPAADGTVGKIYAPIIGSVQTSTTTTTTVASFDMTDETLCAFDVIVTCARRTNVTKGGRYKRSVVYRRTGGGGPTIVGSLESGTDQETTAGDDVTIDVSSNTVRVRVTAADTDTRNWLAELRVQETYST